MPRVGGDGQLTECHVLVVMVNPLNVTCVWCVTQDLRDSRLLLTVCVLVAVNAVLLVVWTAVDAMTMTPVDIEDDVSDRRGLDSCPASTSPLFLRPPLSGSTLSSLHLPALSSPSSFRLYASQDTLPSSTYGLFLRPPLSGSTQVWTCFPPPPPRSFFVLLFQALR